MIFDNNNVQYSVTLKQLAKEVPVCISMHPRI